MRKTIITLGIVAGGLFAATGVAAADDQTIVINESNSSTSASSDCLPAAVLDQLPPWLLLGSVPACP
jgi:hypothetical protein